MTVTANLHDPQRATAGRSEDGGTVWIEFASATGGNVAVFIPADRFDAAVAMVEFFNDSIAPQQADVPA